MEFSAHLWILLILSSLAILTTLSILAISRFWQFWKVWNFGKFENFGNYCNIGNNWNIGNTWNIDNFGNIGNLVTHTKTMILLPIQPINYSIILLASKQHFHLLLAGQLGDVVAHGHRLLALVASFGVLQTSPPIINTPGAKKWWQQFVREIKNVELLMEVSLHILQLKLRSCWLILWPVKSSGG